MSKKIIYLGLVLVLLGCNSKPNTYEWVLKETLVLDDVNPIGIAQKGEELWLSDADHNRLVQIDSKGLILNTIDGFDRPMHIAANQSELFVPQYGSDTIAVISKKQDILSLELKLDAPAGISVYKNEKAIADFYNNRILYYDGRQWISFGDVGNANGQFYYPTDVQITSDQIWVADAYNHRIQVFNKQGHFLKALAYDQGINAATGIFVSEEEVFVTDFENDRILVFNHEGLLKQELKENVHKPTDMYIKDAVLYTLNYREGTINLYQLISVQDI